MPAREARALSRIVRIARIRFSTIPRSVAFPLPSRRSQRQNLVESDQTRLDQMWPRRRTKIVTNETQGF
jgi:hypothetical protein